MSRSFCDASRFASSVTATNKKSLPSAQSFRLCASPYLREHPEVSGCARYVNLRSLRHQRSIDARFHLVTVMSGLRTEGWGLMTNKLVHWRDDIQGLRALAVISVVLFHAGVPLFAGGFVGVDIFFVISGFLITGKLLEMVHQQGRVNFRDFYIMRLKRLLLPAALVILATTGLVVAFGSLTEQQNFVGDPVAAMFSAFNYWLLNKGTEYNNSIAGASPLLHYWSLAVEEQFYIVYPVLVALCLFFAKSKDAFPAVLRVALGVIFVVSLSFSIYQSGASSELAFYSLHTRAWELAQGGLLATVVIRPGQPKLSAKRARVIGALSVLLLLGPVFMFHEGLAFPGYVALAPVVGAFLFIAAGTTEKPGLVSRAFSVAPMVFVGKHSYACYLWHWPLMVIVAPMFADTWLVKLAIGGGLGLALAVATHYTVEKFSYSGVIAKKYWLSFGLAIAVVVSSVAAGALHASISSKSNNLSSGEAATEVDLGGETTPTPTPTQTQLSEAERYRAEVSAELSAKRYALHKQIATSLNVSALPSNLTPDLASSFGSYPVPVKDGCHQDFDYKPLDKDCAYVNDPATAKATLVLFGDSHVGHWFPTVESIAKDNGWAVYNITKAGCPLGDIGVHYSTYVKRNYPECQRWRQDAIDKIAALNPTFVLMGHDDNVEENPGVTDAAWAEAAANTARELQSKTDAQLVFVQDVVQSPEQWTAACLEANPQDIQACTMARDEHLAFPGRRDATADAMSSLGLPLVDPTFWACVDGKCPAVIGNILVARDMAHVTIPFAQVVAPILELELESMCVGGSQDPMSCKKMFGN